MEMIIDFPGGARVDAHFGEFTVKTDQPPNSSAPTPFDVFLSSIGTCAGIYVLGFCRQRGLSTEGMRIIQQVARDPQTGLIGRISLDIKLPAGFPEKYRQAVIQSAQHCAVKKHMEHPPAFDIVTSLS
jgi:ribosomal protein S12 methylthiotransferase accessory factor